METEEKFRSHLHVSVTFICILFDHRIIKIMYFNVFLFFIREISKYPSHKSPVGPNHPG